MTDETATAAVDTPAVSEQRGTLFRIPDGAWTSLGREDRERLVKYWDGHSNEDQSTSVLIPADVLEAATPLERDWLRPFEVRPETMEVPEDTGEIGEFPQFRFFQIPQDSLDQLTPLERLRLEPHRRLSTTRPGYVDYSIPEQAYREGSNNEREWLGLWKVDSLGAEPVATEEEQTAQAEAQVVVSAVAQASLDKLLEALREKDAALERLAAEKGQLIAEKETAEQNAALAAARVGEIVTGFHREAVALQRTKQWCDEGVNEVLDRIGLPQLPRKREFIFEVPVTLTLHVMVMDLSEEVAVAAAKAALSGQSAVNFGHLVNEIDWTPTGVNATRLIAGRKVHRGEVSFDLDSLKLIAPHQSIWQR